MTAPTRWRRGDLCRVRGDGAALFRVLDARDGSAHLVHVDGPAAGLGAGREGCAKLTRVTRAEARKIAAEHRRIADLLDPPRSA